MVEKRQSWQLFALYLILYGLNVQIKKPTILTNGGASVFCLIINLSGRYRNHGVSNVKCKILNILKFTIHL